MKRKLSVFVCALLMLSMFVGTVHASTSVKVAKKVKAGSGFVSAQYDSNYHSNYRKRIGTTTTYVNGQYREYVNIYDANYKYNSYQSIIAKISKPCIFTQSMKTQKLYPTIKVGMNKQVSETDSTSITGSLNVTVSGKASFKKVFFGGDLEVGASVGFTATTNRITSYTTTATDSQEYSITLNDTCKTGTYYWAAVRVYDAVELEVVRRNLSSVNQQPYVADQYTIYPSLHEDYAITFVTPDWK